ncbi:MAG: peptidoglycan D,D-transpeptidase FtsI family protein [Actinomycetota bacterium]
MMQRQIRRVGITLLIAFLAVFAQLNYIQIFAARDIASNPANIRALLREYSIKRGDILTRDGTQIATSTATNDRLKYLREYPEGELFGHLTGFYSVLYGRDRAESAYNDELLGDVGVLSMQDIRDRLFDSGEQGDDVVLTLNSQLQKVAREALGDNRGSVVALDPSTGAVKAMWSNPSYDPGPLADHNTKKERKYWRSLKPRSRTSPLIPLATSRVYPPGSTFKVVSTIAALESGKYKPDSTFPDPDEIELPLTDNTLTNFTRTSCTGGPEIDLFTALEISCDTTYGLIGLEIPDQVRETAEAFGFNERLPFDLTNAVSVFPEIPDEEEPLRAYAGIGQGDVSASPLQMALVAAGVANDGTLMEPRLVHQIIDPSGGVVRESRPQEMSTPMSRSTARTVRDMMVAVVESGTGTNAQIPGIQVAGKTGTSQTAEGADPHAWFIAFAPAEDPEIAVAVIVENGGSVGSEATGGALAAPIAKRLIEADRQISNW